MLLQAWLEPNTVRDAVPGVPNAVPGVPNAVPGVSDAVPGCAWCA